MTKAILLDIEGTTTPVDFVHKVLFPYSRERIGNFVATHFDHLRHEIEELVDESSHDDTYTIPVDPLEPGSVSTYLEHLIDHDRKSTPLKSIQGKIWQDGYANGELKSVVYDDVLPAFKRWKENDITLAIYSSGSELAQRQLFAHTNHGDLTGYLSSYFDTTVGGKREEQSYKNIAEELSTAPGEVLFLSDITEELDAALTAGMRTFQIIREEAAGTDAARHRQATSFDEIRD